MQKRQKDDQKPLEEKIKTLKKRNAELAAIARRLEEKAKHLQQENMKVSRLDTSSFPSIKACTCFYNFLILWEFLNNTVCFVLSWMHLRNNASESMLLKDHNYLMVNFSVD